MDLHPYFTYGGNCAGLFTSVSDAHRVRALCEPKLQREPKLFEVASLRESHLESYIFIWRTGEF